ncbi:Rho GTPase activating protein 39 [Bonamia ostreae]|uniref:Rho GTPase activating protein 39 n=1 Tax=Bonamia ostreae TaxID=126728 RepID=A0ABV2AUB8_9EUKA
MTLEELMQLTENMHRDFPKIIEDCCDAIERKNGFKTQGIFRISCRSEELKRAIDNANSGNYDFAEFESPHVPAVFLKTLFKEMREPVIPNQIVDECAQFGSTNGKENSLTSKTEFEMILKKVLKYFCLLKFF